MSRHTIIMIHDLIELDAYRLCNVQPAPEHRHFDRLLRILMLIRKFCLCSLLRHFYTNINEICVYYLVDLLLFTYILSERTTKVFQSGCDSKVCLRICNNKKKLMDE